MDARTIAELNEAYKCPPDAGPAWRAACEMGIDMSLIECNLELTPFADVGGQRRFDPAAPATFPF